MNRRTTALLGAVAVIGASMTGCSAAEKTATTTRTSSPAATQPTTATVPPSLAATMPPGLAGDPRGGTLDLSKVDQTNPTAVAAAQLRASLTIDTAIDTTRFDAQRRSAPLLTPKLAALSRAPAGGNGGIDARWIALAARHGYTTVTTTNTPQEGQPADTATTAVRSLTVRVTSHGDRGWTSSAPAELWIVTMTKEPAGWRVSAVQDLGQT